MFTLMVKIQLNVPFNVVFHKDPYLGSFFFFNDMFNISNVLFYVLYAHDICIYLRGSDITAYLIC